MPVPLELTRSDGSPLSAHAEMLEAVLAGDGPDRVGEIAARHVGAPVVVVLTAGGPRGQADPALREFVAGWVAGDPAEPPAAVTAVVPVTSKGVPVGAVLMLGEGRPEAEGYLHAAATAVQTGIAVAETRDEMERALSASLIEDLVSGRELGAAEIIARAERFGGDLRGGAVALCVDPGGRQAGWALATIFSLQPGALARTVGDLVYALLPCEPEAARKLAARLGRRCEVGISAHCAEVTELRLALEEARLMLEVGDGAGPPVGERTYRLLFRLLASHPEEVRRFGERTIGPVVRHDEEFSTELVATLAAYLHDHDCNMNLTARAIYTHRHTVSNRLAKVHELTGLDPFRSEDREVLGLAIKARRLAEARAAG